jgi:flavin-binding protein dodecin
LEIEKMSSHIQSGAVKVIEIIGVSQESFEDAVQKGVSKASESIQGITGIEVIRHSAKVKDGQITEYHSNMKVAFAVK